MRVLLLGGTGNVGSRLLSALIQREHTVFAFVRDPSKLAPGVQDKLAVTQNRCDAIVNTAGLAAMAPWGKSDLPDIVEAVTTAALEAGQERGSPLRVWYLGGQSILDIPTKKCMIMDYVWIFPTHRFTWNRLRSLPPSAIAWSILCPNYMNPLSETTYPFPAEASADNLVASASVPPDWSLKFLRIPLIGVYLNILSQASGYATLLEDNADLVAKDLLDGHDSKWIHQKVGTKQRQH
ncbi:hypothetical protein N7476_006921 [Penicillium atrosanguineum]|uniref:NAD-dependent epimerase/dehydratase domain-containing protein n=2 Tax=Penicillium atrosanguineum TaxID=1132637 RepID=A0A9W9PTD5_9EURO|nr:hypothetical protein N7476_006921 [Penicillium atrosanguineum]